MSGFSECPLVNAHPLTADITASFLLTSKYGQPTFCSFTCQGTELAPTLNHDFTPDGTGSAQRWTGRLTQG